MGSVLGADGAGKCSSADIEHINSHMVIIGTVIASSDSRDPLLYKRVFLTPMRGWENDSDAPESE
jgi:hypothetical protein